ncbi:uncharacterized protein PAC_13001 [Phialocephala subalpina]|uniref:BTB domain-containing protein n=1 Tax=Phialocephala subalpina TaxID=576137 RepID=A0A1L7XDK3_9HELO|nr:uncharacterized protein PAC_13001 [Phialocephala subalpina]
MASTNAQERLLDSAFEDFATSLLPLYSGPQVTIRIGSASHEYKLPKALLCKQSPYFAAMFEGSFKEGEEQSTTLEEVTPRSFQMLVQWVCLGRVVFREHAPDVAITTAIEFARLAIIRANGAFHGSGVSVIRRGHSAKSQWKTQKRKRSSSPLDQLGSADEAERQNQEAMAEERIDAADDDFSSRTLVDTHGQQPRRSTRQKIREA